MKLGIVIPCFNEENNIIPLFQKLTSELVQYKKFILFIDDGSTDNTLNVLRTLTEQNKDVYYLSFSRNFGHQKALKAGYDHIDADCVVSLDADLQHPPELIHKMIAAWQEGFEVISSIRADSTKVSFMKRNTARIFYAVFNSVTTTKIHNNTADFRLIDRKVLLVIKDMKEDVLFFRALFPWLGFKHHNIEYQPNIRMYGQTKYNMLKMLSLSLSGITSFSLSPLRISYLFGIFFSFISLIYATYAILIHFFTDQTVPGWTSILVCLLFISGLQFIIIGVIGEYVGKTFMESKNRPPYVISEQNFHKEENRM
ncbi:glycosyltransferase [Sphingobacterium faecium]|uniref:glycosyltransferase family 2 protein n=1 Tax=Sphingobacterium faecium TaxID=34087 RepID=UPI003DA38DE6